MCDGKIEKAEALPPGSPELYKRQCCISQFNTPTLVKEQPRFGKSVAYDHVVIISMDFLKAFIIHYAIFQTLTSHSLLDLIYNWLSN